MAADLVVFAGVRDWVFDLDDTLYPERSFAISGFRAVADAFAGRLRSPGDLFERLCRLFDGPDRGRVYDVVARECGAADAEALTREMVHVHRTHRPAIRLFPDADAALARLAGECHLAIISDGYAETQRAKLAALRLPARVTEIILTDEWGREFWKPHPRAFQQMATRLGVPPAACAYVADNRAKDFIAPRALGWKTVCIDRPGGVYRTATAPLAGEPESSITSLDELETVLSLDRR